MISPLLNSIRMLGVEGMGARLGPKVSYMQSIQSSKESGGLVSLHSCLHIVLRPPPVAILPCLYKMLVVASQGGDDTITRHYSCKNARMYLQPMKSHSQLLPRLCMLKIVCSHVRVFCMHVWQAMRSFTVFQGSFARWLSGADADDSKDPGV